MSLELFENIYVTYLEKSEKQIFLEIHKFYKNNVKLNEVIDKEWEVFSPDGWPETIIWWTFYIINPWVIYLDNDLSQNRQFNVSLTIKIFI